MKITRIAHVCMNTPNLRNALRFYVDGLGFRKKFDFVDKQGLVFGAYLEISPGSYLEFFENAQGKSVNTGIIHFCLETDDIDGLRARLQAAGISSTDKKLGADHSWQTWVTDPDGNRIEFHQYTSESSQITGQTCKADWR